MGRKIKGFIKTDMVGSKCEFEEVLEDGEEYTEEELEEIAKDVAFDHIEWNYEVVDEDTEES